MGNLPQMPGLLAFTVGMTMVGLGLLGMGLALSSASRTPLPAGFERPHRGARLVLGPLVCAVVGRGYATAAELAGARGGALFDTLSPACAIAGLGVWIALGIVLLRPPPA